MSGEYAWVSYDGYCHSVAKELAYQMRKDAGYATSYLAADFVETLGRTLLFQIAYEEAGDSSVDAEQLLNSVDRLIETLQSMRERIPLLITEGNDVSLVSRDDDMRKAAI